MATKNKFQRIKLNWNLLENNTKLYFAIKYVNTRLI